MNAWGMGDSARMNRFQTRKYRLRQARHRRRSVRWLQRQHHRCVVAAGKRDQENCWRRVISAAGKTPSPDQVRRFAAECS
ncbi:hypothetical protein IEQ34_017386 [Dendrobium chrysotoxum]|uniref:Uncharacterized protein n=1 Tax=Dendrobium chrysotoxum TaxID=161865 RepID=A0AAV7GBV1_DENCH|nr:hypothetical protein IEQ34_017386 [Dendrobium chrysotoxum]